MVKKTIFASISGIILSLIFIKIAAGTFITDFVMRNIAPYFGIAVDLSVTEITYLIFTAIITAIVVTLLLKGKLDFLKDIPIIKRLM